MFRIFRDILNRQNEFSSSEGKESQIMNRVMKGKTVEVAPTSSRFYTRGNDGKFSSGEASMEQYSGGVKQGKPSTAIQNITYNPKTHICSIVFKNGDGKAYDYKMTPKEFETFISADSKGRYVNEVMKYQNRISGHPLK